MKINSLKNTVIAAGLATLMIVTNFQTTLSDSKTPRASLPIVVNTYKPSPTNIFGMEITWGDQFAKASMANVGWLRDNHYAIKWGEIEGTPGARNWDTSAALQNALALAVNASKNGVTYMPTIRGTPPWASKYSVVDYTCGPIAQSAFDAFGNFMFDLVSRYSKEPYNIKYWELGNEPDKAYSSVGAVPYDVWGCWGDANDDYFGGSYYGEMLKKVYPRIKAADPSAQVVIGGLLMGCNPNKTTGSGSCDTADKRKAGKFLEGILKSGAGNSFDIVNFHAYDYLQSTAQVGNYSAADWDSSWTTTGPIIEAKVAFIRQLLSQYGVSSKLLMNSETAALCLGCGTAFYPSVEPSKAAYMAQAGAMAKAEGLIANIWYGYNPGWNQTDLVSQDGTVNDAYKALLNGTSQIGDAQFVSKVTSYSGVKAYEFLRRGRKVWVMWSLGAGPVSVNLPSAPSQIVDDVGNILTASQTVQLTPHPLYIEFP